MFSFNLLSDVAYATISFEALISPAVEDVEIPVPTINCESTCNEDPPPETTYLKVDSTSISAFTLSQVNIPLFVVPTGVPPAPVIP
jgi:hypothetical protein